MVETDKRPLVVETAMEDGLRQIALKKKEEYEATHSKERSYFYASEVFKCKRQLYFDWILSHVPVEDEEEEVVKINTNLQRVFTYGEEAHERIIATLRKGGLKVEDEVPIPENDELIHGRIDGVAYEDDKDTPTVIEIKTKNARVIKEPTIENLGQLQLYLHYTGFKHGILVYESKHNQQNYYFRFTPDEVIINDALNYFREMKGYIDRNETPPFDDKYRVDKYPCSFCKYQDKCYPYLYDLGINEDEMKQKGSSVIASLDDGNTVDVSYKVEDDDFVEIDVNFKTSLGGEL